MPPLIACYGERDWLFRGNPDTLRRRLSRSAVEHEIEVYPGVGHSFLTDGVRPLSYALSYPLFRIRYDEQVAERAWAQIMRFFDHHLGERRPPTTRPAGRVG